MMKKKIIIFLSALAIVLLSAGIFLKMQNSFTEKANTTKTGKTIQMSGSYAIDPNNLAALAGITDNVFVGEVIKEIETVYPEPAKTPFTVYEVKVIENLKGEFSESKPLKLYKDGGYAENGNLYIYENDEMPEQGNYYIFATYTQNPNRDLPAGSIIASGMNSNIPLNKSRSVALNSNELKEFQDAVTNQIPFERERGTIVDSETYLNKPLDK